MTIFVINCRIYDFWNRIYYYLYGDIMNNFEVLRIISNLNDKVFYAKIYSKLSFGLQRITIDKRGH